MDEDVRVFKNRFHRIRIRHEIGGEITAVELHTFDPINCRLCAFCFFDGDDAIFTDFLHRIGDEVADRAVVVRGDSADLCDLLLVVTDRLADLLQFLNDFRYREVDTALEVHRVRAGSDVLHAFANDCLGKHCCRCRSVAGDIGCFACNFAHHLRAHVFNRLLELDFFRDRDAVLRDSRRTEFLIDDNVASLRAERCFHRICEFIDAAL